MLRPADWISTWGWKRGPFPLKDNTVAPDTYTSVVETLGEKATVIKFPIGHFDIYHGEYFEKAVAAQVKFIKAWANTS